MIHADLKVGPNLGSALCLRANDGVSSNGMMLAGGGFQVINADVPGDDPGGTARQSRRLRPYVGGRDLIAGTRDRWVADFYGLTESESREGFPELYQWILDRVKPARMGNAHGTKDSEEYAAKWWLFAKPRGALRGALAGLPRYIATTETAKHRHFQFLDQTICPDHMVVAIALGDAWQLGVLSCRVHVVWALATGARLGVGDDPRYTKSRCFDPFPFPNADEPTRQRIRVLGERLDAHRKARQAAHPDLTITGMYNVLEKLRSGESLTDKERVIHEHGLVSVLSEIHDDLDAAVLAGYGWAHDLDDEGILVNLVALNAERAAEEKRSLIRWLRPEFQQPGVAAAQTLSLGLPVVAPEEIDVAPAKWPATLSDRITAVRESLARSDEALGVEQVARRFKGARRADVEAILESLSALGIAVSLDAGKGRRWMRARAAA